MSLKAKEVCMELMFVKVGLNSKPMCVMIKTGATHNFISMKKVRKLGLKMTKESGDLRSLPQR